MAEQGSSQERTERATPKRRRQARERGDLPRSRELTTLGVVGGSVLAMVAFGASLARGGAELMRGGLSPDPALLADPSLMPRVFGAALLGTIRMLLPLLAASFACALLAPMALGGWNFAPQSMLPKFERLDPLQGLQRMFASGALVELGKSLLKFVILGGIATLFCWRSLHGLMGLGSNGAPAGIADAFTLMRNSLLWLCGGLALIAAVDVPWQLWEYAKRLRMTRQELREEFKESEGRPEVKARIRRLQQEMASRRMMEKVPTADVIVTNPTHYAVALQYASGAMRAPRLVAKGTELVADKIRELAREHRVPIVSAPPLARALYRHCDLDAEIPANLYAAVAQILGYVYQLRNWRSGAPPQVPVVGDVPGGELDPVE